MKDDNTSRLPIKDLLAADDNRSHPNALPASIGDRYLCCHNALFARVRELALEWGFSFVHAGGGAWSDYMAFQVLSLGHIYEERQIPYVDNVTALRRMVAANPAVALDTKFFIENVRRNFVFHEACHCLGYAGLRNAPLLKHWYPSEPEQWVVINLFAEAVATGAERIAVGLVDGNSHMCFFSLNSYFMCHPARRKAVLAAMESIGFEKLLELAFFSICTRAMERI